MGDVDTDWESSGPGARARFTVRCWVKLMRRIGFHLGLGFGSYVRA